MRTGNPPERRGRGRAWGAWLAILPAAWWAADAGLPRSVAADQPAVGVPGSLPPLPPGYDAPRDPGAVEIGAAAVAQEPRGGDAVAPADPAFQPAACSTCGGSFHLGERRRSRPDVGLHGLSSVHTGDQAA